MLKVIIGVAIGIILALIIAYIKKYLKENHLRVNWQNVFIALLIIIFILFVIWFIYSFIGISKCEKIAQPNGNVCSGYKYGMKFCSGDINAE